MSFEYIQNYYKVPAKKGARVRYDGNQEGVITSTDGQYIRVKMDGRKYSQPYHPTWRMEYL